MLIHSALLATQQFTCVRKGWINMTARKGTSYEIKTYEERFIEEQARIGTEATKDWTMYRQTPAEELRRSYLAAAFDSSTRFYALVGNELVGFLTASITAGTGGKTAVMRLPLAKKGHEKVQKLLMKQALKVLKEKGASTVTAEVGKGWGNWEALMREYEFVDSGVSSYLAEKTMSALDSSKLPLPNGVEAYDRSKDRDAFLTMLSGFGMPPERARLVMDQYESGAKSSYFKRVVVFRKDGKPVAASAVTVPDNEPDVARALRVLGMPGVDLSDIRGKIIRKLLELGVKDGLKRFRIMLMPDAVHDYDDVFAKMGMNAVPFVHTYTRRL